MYPGLKLISMEEGRTPDGDRETVSPEIPVLCPTPIKGMSHVLNMGLR